MGLTAEQLKSWATMNDAAVAAVEEMAKRERARRETNLAQFRNELSEKFGEINSGQLHQAFKKAQSLGLGALVDDPETGSAKFVWNYNLKEVAQAAKGKLDAAKLAPAKAWSKPPRQSVPKGRQASRRVISEPVSQPTYSKSAESIKLVIISGMSGEVFSVPADKSQLLYQFIRALSD